MSDFFGECCSSCPTWATCQYCPCCDNNDANQLEDDKKKKNEANNPLVGKVAAGISAPNSGNMQRFTNLRY